MNRSYLRYAWPVLLTAAALGVRMVLDPVLGSRIPYATFYVAVTISAVVGGAIPGLMATFLGALAAAYFILAPRHSFLIDHPNERLGLALDLIVSVALVTLAELQRRARARAERSEETERLERQRFEVTLASIGDGVIAADCETRITYLNEVAAELTGWTAAEAMGEPIDSVFAIRNEDTGETVENPARRAIREGRIVGLANHTVLVARDGTLRPIDDSGAPMVGPDGRVIGAVLVFRDITGVKQREAELRSRSRMIDLSHDAIIVMDGERRVLSWNLGAWEMYGFEEEEARGRSLIELLHTRNGKAIEEATAALLREGRWDGELTHTCKDGREIVVESRHVLLRNLGNEAAGILEINRDITERKRAEEELRRTAAEAEEGRRTLEAVLEHIPEGLTIVDAEGRIRLLSREGASIAGQPRERLEGLSPAEHVKVWGFRHEDGTPARAEELPLQRAVRSGETSTDEEWTIQRPDGESRIVLGKAAPIRDSEGRITGGLVAWRDISERKRLEQKLRETAKLESLGVLAGGIAHDFNNLLTGVMGNASLLSEALPEGSTLWDYAQNIGTAAEQAAKLSQQMLAYSGRGRFVVEPLDLSAYIRRTMPLIESSIPKPVHLVLDLAEELPAIEADAAQLQQVVMNLAINGAEAIGAAAGRVTLTTRAISVDEQYIRSLLIEENLRPGTYVALEVSDTGCGMDEKTVGRIFDPFFTTKFLGRGLGLAAVQGIVRGHKGSIKVYSAPGQGTTIRILFPVTAATAAARPGAHEPVEQRSEGGSGTVLVIDDEEIIRATANNVLRRLGYAVVTASDGAEGLEIFRSLKDRILVVVLDLTMPGLSGEETLDGLRRIDPEVPVVLSSGFGETEAMRQFRRHRLEGFLQKPYSVKTLAVRVRSAAKTRQAGNAKP